MKLNYLLKLLLTPFMMFAVEEGGGGAEDRGDTLSDGAPVDEVEEIVDPLAEVATEGDPKDEVDPNAEVDPKDTKGKKDTRIPLARHKEMMDKSREKYEALAAELARTKQGAAATQTNEAIEATETKLVGLETEYSKLLADGEIDKATAKMSEIRRLERTIGDQKSDLRAQETEARAVERVRFDTTIERLETAFPVLNPDAPEFDNAVVGEVLDLQKAFQLNGLTPSAAIQKAVKYVLGAETSKQVNAVEVTPKVDKTDVAAQRKQDALKRNIDAAKRTPASTAKVGLNNEDGGELTAEKAMSMNQDEFSKLDEATLARMRGDVMA